MLFCEFNIVNLLDLKNDSHDDNLISHLKWRQHNFKLKLGFVKQSVKIKLSYSIKIILPKKPLKRKKWNEFFQTSYSKDTCLKLPEWLIYISAS